MHVGSLREVKSLDLLDSGVPHSRRAHPIPGLLAVEGTALIAELGRKRLA